MEGQTVSGDTNVAQASNCRSACAATGTTPSALRTASLVVNSDGTYSTTFDLNEQNIGDEYDIELDA
jgi:hypothetical protein